MMLLDRHPSGRHFLQFLEPMNVPDCMPRAFDGGDAAMNGPRSAQPASLARAA